MATLIFTGTGRSGTTYLAEVMGIGHERSFTPTGLRHPVIHDSSVFAFPYVTGRPDDWWVVHAVREPTSCIASLTPGHVFAVDGHQSRYRDFCLRQFPEVYGQPTALARATWWYWCVNQRLENSDCDELVRVEDITDDDIIRWASIMRSDPEPKLRRLWKTPKTTNTRQVEKPTVTWDDLPPEVQGMAERYGYT